MTILHHLNFQALVYKAHAILSGYNLLFDLLIEC